MGNAPDEWIEAVEEFVRGQVRGGFVAIDEIAENAVEYMDGEAEPDEVRPVAEQAVAREVAALEAEMQTWPLPTDNDRLDAAFESLEAQGIVARQDFWCCQTCGHAAMPDEMREAGAHGYTFYHQQDTESAVQGGGLFLAYGSTDPDGEVAVGERIRNALEKVGLQVDWNGQANQRLFVRLDWRRPPLR